MEIEKKFRVKNLPENLETFEKKEIEQGYLCTSPVVRIRRSNEKYILTYKSKFGIDENFEGVRVNQEVEVELSKEGYEHLKTKVDDNLISKTRYIVPLDDEHIGELDVFHGCLDGLYFIEVEFKDNDDADKFIPPAWFGENVSDDERYANSFLSKCNDLSAFQ